MSDGGPPPVWRVRWYHLLIPLLASIAAPLLAVGIVIAWIWLSGAPLQLAKLTADFYFLCLIQAASQVGMLGAALWLLWRNSDPELPARFTRPGGRALALGLGAAVMAMAALGLFEYLCDTFLHTHLGDDAARLPITPRNWSQLPVGVLVIVILAPLSEEAYFRGLALGWGRQHWGRGIAVLFSSVLFGLVHLKWAVPGGLDGWLISAELTAMGAVLALVAMRTRTLWASCATHALNNLCALGLLFLFPPS
jgi:membrane protease YdiL (CAAX protease family)